MTTLASLALLKTRFDIEKTDFLDSLQPFFAYVIVSEKMDDFSALDIKNRILDNFGLLIPRHAVDLLLRRMAKRDQLIRADKRFSLSNLVFDLAEFERHRAEASQHQNAAEAGLVRHAKEVLNTDLSKSEAENALNDYIDQYSIECIKAYSSGSIVPVHGKSNKHWPFIVSSYVNSLSECDPDKFRYLVTVVMGRMLSNALIGDDLGTIDMKFKDTCVYLDTPIILQLLGVLGDAAELLAEEMLALLIKNGSEVAIFDHIATETDQVLSNAQRNLDNGNAGRGDVLSALRNLGYTASDVAVLRSAVASRLADRRISIKPTPAYIHELQIDEKAIEVEMETSGLFYRAESAKIVDINSIRSIYVLRRGKFPRRIEDCGAILVTNNHGLARAAYAYGKNHEASRELSTIVTDFSLTNLLWLKFPMEYSDIPRRVIAANCFAALHPSDDFWGSFLMQLDSMKKMGHITPLQHQFLRYELRAKRDLMNLTLGDEACLSEQQIQQVVDRYEHEITKPLHDKLGKLESEIKLVQGQRDEMSVVVGNVENTINFISWVVNKAVSTILVLSAIFFIALAHGWFGGDLIKEINQPWKYILKGGVYLIDAFIVAHLFIHVSLWNPVSKFATLIENKITEKLKQKFGFYQDN